MACQPTGIYYYTKRSQITRSSVKFLNGWSFLSPPEAAYYDENYDYEESIAAENGAFEHLPEIQWFDKHSRRKRDVISPSKAELLQYKVCVR